MNNQNTFDMNDYFVKWQDGRLSPTEDAQLQAWLREGDHKNEWQQLQDVWQAASLVPIPQGTDVERQWQNLLERLPEEAPIRVRPKPTASFSPGRLLQSLFRPSPGWAVALAALVAIVAYQLGVNPFGTSMQTYEVPFGQRVEITLSDGSIVELNGGSTLQYPKSFGNEQRNVELKGEGYFKVKPGATPFVVATANAITRVLGTEFNVKTWGRDTQVFVNSGKVTVKLNHVVQAPEVILLPGKLAICEEGPISVHSIENPGDLLAWRQGRLVFNRTPLREVLAEMERVFNLRIKADDTLLEHTISARFSSESVSMITRTLAASLNASVRSEQDGYYLVAN